MTLTHSPSTTRSSYYILAHNPSPLPPPCVINNGQPTLHDAMNYYSYDTAYWKSNTCGITVTSVENEIIYVMSVFWPRWFIYCLSSVVPTWFGRLVCRRCLLQKVKRNNLAGYLPIRPMFMLGRCYTLRYLLLKLHTVLLRSVNNFQQAVGTLKVYF